MTNPCDNSGLNIRVNSAILSGQLSGIPGPAGPTGCPTLQTTVTIPNVAVGKYYITYSKTASNITYVVAAQVGDTPSVVWNIRHGANYSGIGTALFASSRTTTSAALGNKFPTEQAFAVGGATVAEGSHIWLSVDSAAAGTTLHLTLFYKPECLDILTDKGIILEQADGTEHFVPLVDVD